jgi:hypothetical protein
MILSYSWDAKAYKYSIEESPKSVDEANELDQYVFVVRARIEQRLPLICCIFRCLRPYST